MKFTSLLLLIFICSFLNAAAQTSKTSYASGIIYDVKTHNPINLADLETPDSLLTIEDSLLTIYINDLAQNSKLPYDSIRKIENDTTHRFMHFITKRAAKERGVILDDAQLYPINDEKVRFILKERTKADLRKSR